MNPFSINKNFLKMKNNNDIPLKKKIIINDDQKHEEIKKITQPIYNRDDTHEKKITIQSILQIDDVIINSHVYYCIYHKNKHDFLEYILEKDNKNIMTLPKTYIQKKYLFDESKKFIKTIPLMRHYKIDGYLLYKKDIFVFVNAEKDDASNKMNYIKETNTYWWVCVDEIINQKKILYFVIDKSIISLFLHYPQMCFLYDEYEEPTEIPTILYFGTYYKFLNYAYSIGLPGQTSRYMKYGSYFYYLTDYTSSIRYAGWTVVRNNEDKNIDKYGRFEQGGIIRSAVFLKDTKYFLNRPYDKNDTSKISMDKDKKFIKMTDYNGDWSNKYNSVYSGITRIVEDDRFTNIPMFVIRNFNQIHSLSVHIVDKSSLKETWDYNDKYKIV